MNDFKQIVFEIVNIYKEKYRNSDHADAGCNGPYKMVQLPTRNTAHWIISFSIMYKFTGDMEYRRIVWRFTKYLVDAVKKDNYAVRYLEDEFNIIGLAWVIEALLYASDLLDDVEPLRIAEKIFLSQQYDKKKHIWIAVNGEGKELGVDVAFNHNLWFAMAGAKLCKKEQCDEIEFEVSDFLKFMDKQFLSYRNGLICHFIKNSGDVFRDVKHLVRKMIFQVTGKDFPWKKRNWVEYERAYHLFSVYAFAQLKLLYPDLDLFQNKKMRKVLAYSSNINHFITFEHAFSYSYAYNSPAYEYPLVQKVFFPENFVDPEKVFKVHCDTIFDEKTKVFSKNTVDVDTLNARVYETMQLYELESNV